MAESHDQPLGPPQGEAAPAPPLWSVTDPAGADALPSDDTPTIISRLPARPARVDLNATNTQAAWGADLSEKFDLTKEDQADDLLFNEVIWRSVKGPSSQMPAPVRAAWVFPHRDQKD